MPPKKKKKKIIKRKKTGKVLNKKKTTTITGKYHFNGKEKTDLSSDLANKQIDMRLVEDEKKSIVAGYKDKLDRFKWDINRLSRCVVDGFEMREFECWIEKDFDAEVKRYINIHTKEVVEERAFDPSDYQHELSI